MPPRGSRGALRSKPTNRRAGGQRDPPAPPPHVLHDNGSLETSFQVNVIPPPPPVLRQQPTTIPDAGPSGTTGVPLRQGEGASTQSLLQSLCNLNIAAHAENTQDLADEEEDFDLNAVSAGDSDADSSGAAAQSSVGLGDRPRGSGMNSGQISGQPTLNIASSASQSSKSGRFAARDVHTFFSVDPQNRDRKQCIYCLEAYKADEIEKKDIASYKISSSTTSYRSHLSKYHIQNWVDACDHLKITIGGEEFQAAVEEVRRQRGNSSEDNKISDGDSDRLPFSPEAFVDAIMDFVVGDDQSINVIESPHLRRIFLMLREDLDDSDIPHRSMLRARIMEVWNEHINVLSKEMKGALGKVSFTSDLWSDSNLSPFMAVTAHWIEATLIPAVASSQPQYILKLRAELIGFHKVPGRHSGPHIAQAFLEVLDRYGIEKKIGWVTLDNASNNDTFMEKLEMELRLRNISFDKKTRRIRCFPHIVNLACKAIISAFSNMDHAREPITDEEFVSVLDAISGDPIATLRAVIRAIRASSIRRQYFAELVIQALKRELQLLRDIDVRWSSTYYMIERAILLEGPLTEMIENSDFEELRKYKLTNADWEVLFLVRNILLVPHAFQQLLSGEKTPTLCGAIPAFEHFAKSWRDLQAKEPSAHYIIQDGLDKLQIYSNRADEVPAYTVAMILNPRIKLDHYKKHAPLQLASAQELFLKEVQPYFDALQRQNVASASASLPSADGESVPERAVYPDGTPPRIRRQRAVQETSEQSPAEILGLAASANSTPNTVALDEEFEAYLNDTSSIECTDILAYWQENQLRFPVLFRAALDYLAIQASSVPCERVFSSAKETMTARRSRIGPELMEALQMLKFSLNHGQGLSFSRGTAENLREELEQYLQSIGPDN